MKRLFLLLILSLFCFDNANSQWEPCNNGIYGGLIYSISISGNYIVAGSDTGIVFISTNDGDSWTDKNTKLRSGWINSISMSGCNIVAGSYCGGIGISTDYGESWSIKNNGPFLNPCAYSTAINGNNIFTFIGDSIYNSSDLGVSWMEKNNGLPKGMVRSIVFNGNDIFISKRNLFVSTDIGDNWLEKNSGYNHSFIMSISISGNNIYYLCSQGEVFQSSDNCNTWNQIRGGSDNTTVVFFALAAIKKNIFIGTDSGVIYLSTDSGISCIEKNIDSISDRINTITFNNKYIFAGTQGSGVYRAKFSDFGINDVSENPNVNQLSIFPNPVNDLLQIRYSGNINTVKIINELGCIVETGLRPVSTINGLYQIDTRNFPMGNYFCVINSGQYSETRKFVVVR